MIPALRADFNARYTDDKYQELLRLLDAQARCHIDFRIAETPCFFPKELFAHMAQAGAELTHQLVDNPRYMELSNAAIPERWRMANDTRRRCS